MDEAHEVVLLPVAGQVELTCLCAWTAVAPDREEAERLAADHEGRDEVPVEA